MFGSAGASPHRSALSMFGSAGASPHRDVLFNVRLGGRPPNQLYWWNEMSNRHGRSATMTRVQVEPVL
jgi:hypothetical protein